MDNKSFALHDALCDGIAHHIDSTWPTSLQTPQTRGRRTLYIANSQHITNEYLRQTPRRVYGGVVGDSSSFSFPHLSVFTIIAVIDRAFTHFPILRI